MKKLTLGQLKKLVKESLGEPIKLECTEITPEQITAAEQILIDNGIDEYEVDTVLQAVGYALLDTELYPED